MRGPPASAPKLRTKFPAAAINFLKWQNALGKVGLKKACLAAGQD
jgi:hypothetical protein